MERLYRKICIPLLLIDTNIYAFLSGIFISLSTNIFTSLCFDVFEWRRLWCLYLSTIMFLISGAVAMYISCKVSRIQKYIEAKHIEERNEQYDIVMEATISSFRLLIIVYVLLFMSLFLGCVLLLLNQFFI